MLLKFPKPTLYFYTYSLKMNTDSDKVVSAGNLSGTDQFEGNNLGGKYNGL